MNIPCLLLSLVVLCDVVSGLSVPVANPDTSSFSSRGNKKNDRMWMLVHDVDAISVTLAWEPISMARVYEVQLQQGGSEAPWVTVSDKLIGTVVRKKNLSPTCTYAARVRARDEVDWGDFCPAVEFTTLAGSVKRMDAPTLLQRDGEAVTMQWTQAPEAQTYEVQFRSDHDCQWEVASSTIKGLAMRKKNLKPQVYYYFRVMPSTIGDAMPSDWVFSAPSAPVNLPVLSPFISKLLGGANARLINNAGKETTAMSLAGSLVGVYCSASWCGPCRQFTPQLVNFYVQMKHAKHPFEIVLISCDRDENSFKNYLGHMPWNALVYDSPAREEAMATLNVQGIPWLGIFGMDGNLIQGQVQPQHLNENSMKYWLQGMKSV